MVSEASKPLLYVAVRCTACLGPKQTTGILGERALSSDIRRTRVVIFHDQCASMCCGNMLAVPVTGVSVTCLRDRGHMVCISWRTCVETMMKVLLTSGVSSTAKSRLTCLRLRFGVIWDWIQRCSGCLLHSIISSHNVTAYWNILAICHYFASCGLLTMAPVRDDMYDAMAHVISGVGLVASFL